MLKLVKNGSHPRENGPDITLFRRIEEALLRHPEVLDAAVDPVVYGEEPPLPTAFVVSSSEGLTPEVLAAHLANCPEIAPDERPVRYVLVPAIPRTISGKLQRQKLAHLLDGHKNGAFGEK